MTIITSADELIGANIQTVKYDKTVAATYATLVVLSSSQMIGVPEKTLFAECNTTTGVVPTQAVQGYPRISAMTGGVGRISRIEFGNVVAGSYFLYDCLFSAGPCTFPAGSYTLSGQPSYSSRLPGGSYEGLELWIEGLTPSASGEYVGVTITYTNQSGTGGRVASVASPAAFFTNTIAGRMLRIPLAAGDSGIQKIESIVTSVATTGTPSIIVHVLRPLWFGRMRYIGDGDTHDILKTGGPVVYDNTAFKVMMYPDASASLGLITIAIDIAS